MAGVENKSKKESLVNKREKYFARLQALYDVGKKCIDLASKKQSYSADLESFVSCFQRIEDDYAIFEQTIDELNMLNSVLDKEDKLTDLHSNSMAYDEVYFHVKSLARKMKVDQLPTQPADATTPPQTQQTPSAPQVARLPKLKNEPFDGSISSWPNFYALSNSLINKNASLSKSEKLTYLRCLRKSHALSLI